MKKLILYTAVILINILSSHTGFSYDLKVKNFTYLASNILEFDIYMKGPSPQYYWTAQYAFNFNPAFANGGNLKFTFRNSSDLPNVLRPPCLGVFGNELRLSPNLPNANFFPNPFVISTTGDGSKIIRIRVTTTACAFAGNLNLTWRNSADGGFYTKIYDAEVEPDDPDDPFFYYFTSLTNITNSANHTIDPTVISASNVTVSANSTSPQNYLTLEQAFTAINTKCPVDYTGKHVEVNINANTTETSSAVLSSAGQFTFCLIQPSANNITITAASNANNLVVLDGAANVIIDGRVNQAGGTQLTFNNSLPGNLNSCVRMKNGAHDNLINFARFNGLSGATGGTTLAISQTTSTGNNNNRVENNIINKGKTGIENSGTPGVNANTGNIFKSNFIRNCSSAGISLGNGSTGSNVVMNEFKNDVTTSLAADYAAIECKAEGTNDIQRNKIYDDLINPGNTNYYGIQISSGAAASVINVNNNFIMFNQNNLKNIKGVYTHNATSVTANIFHNSILLKGTGTGTDETFGIYAAVENNYNQKNNICINKRTGGAVNSAINIVTNANDQLDIDYNCYWSDQTTGKSGGWNSTYVPKIIVKYQCLAFPNEKNTIFKDVSFATTDLHLANTSVGDIDLTGTPIPLVTTDIDGLQDSRDDYVPYMGADEASAFVFNGTIKLRAYIDNYPLPRTGNFDVEIWECDAAGETKGAAPLGFYDEVDFSSNGIVKINCPAAIGKKFYLTISHPGFIETWSKIFGETFSTKPGEYLEYNFTTGADKAFASNMKTCSNKAFIFYGDTPLYDGYVNLADVYAVYFGQGSGNPDFDMSFDLPAPVVNGLDVCIVVETNSTFAEFESDPTINGKYINRPGKDNDSYPAGIVSPGQSDCSCNPIL